MCGGGGAVESVVSVGGVVGVDGRCGLAADGGGGGYVWSCERVYRLDISKLVRYNVVDVCVCV